MDISVDGDCRNSSLICESEITTSQSPPPSSVGNLYLHHENQSTAENDSIEDGDRGWIRTRANTTAGYRQVILRRESTTGAHEGTLTCEIPNDNNPIRSIKILYPSELLTP